MRGLQNKSILITGAAMGLGYAAALECADQGARLALVDLDGDKLTESSASLRRQRPRTDVVTVVADAAKDADVARYTKATVDAFGRIDGFYNNAGIEGRQAPLVEYDLEVFRRVIDVNLLGVYLGMRHVIPVMVRQKAGRIVNVASVGGIRGVLNQTAYVASKHAVTGMTKNAALEYARDGVITNAIAPGAILTPMVAEAFRQVNAADPKQAEREYASANPTKRLGLPEEVAKLVAFLLSDDCTYVNGQVIAIDGGQSVVYGSV
jgi:NAD(P)-dependent dehydrogenase (short-subunit alcohol dehydrogenase family)